MAKIVMDEQFSLKIVFGFLDCSKPMDCWSNVSHKFYKCHDNGSRVWEAEGLPVKMEKLIIGEILNKLAKMKGLKKDKRPVVMRFDSERFPIKEKCGMENWNGVIYVDLDLNHHQTICNYNDNERARLYSSFIKGLKTIAPNNFFYIEHSSSGVGIHMMFCFDCEKTDANYHKYAYWIKTLFTDKLKEYVPEVESIMTTQGVFDSVYDRPYQKLFLTGNDAMVFAVNGDCSDIVVEMPEESTQTEPEYNERIEYGDVNVRLKKEYTMHYPDRFYLITALKRFVGDEAKAKSIWYQICDKMTLYDNYTTDTFKLDFDKLWNKVDAKYGRIEILHKYGVNVDDRELHIHLRDDEYLGDITDILLENIVPGINLIEAAPGVGKTEIWKKLAYDWTKDLLNKGVTKPILVVEPMNSIVKSKYIGDTFDKVIGSKKIKSGFGGCVVTNYNHCLKKTYDGYEPLDNPDEFFSQYSLVIVDESHLLVKDDFRSDVVIPFLETLNRCKTTKIVIQTGTPMFEKSVLDIKKHIVVHKKQKQQVKVLWREVADDNFNIAQIVCLVNYYVANGRKTYVYWTNGSNNNMVFLKNLMSNLKCSIYHKRNSGDEDMTLIDNKHNIGDNDVIISSVYFGVGNDLNDEIDKAAVIVIGCNSWQEDIQAMSRWRMPKDLEMCIIVKPDEKEDFEASMNVTQNFVDIYNSVKWKCTLEWNDKLNREKSVIIGRATWQMREEWYIEYIAKMMAAKMYSQQTKVKIDEFGRHGYLVKPNYKMLIENNDWLYELKEHKARLKAVRNKSIIEMLNGEYNWDEINKDSKIELCAKTISRLNSAGLTQYCKHWSYTGLSQYKTFLRYYNLRSNDDDDLAELFCIMWTTNSIKQNKNKEIELDFGGKLVILKKDTYLKICGYIAWLRWREKTGKDVPTQWCYFRIFSKIVNDFVGVEEKLLERLYVKISTLNLEEQFFDTALLNPYREVKSFDDFMEWIEAKNDMSTDSVMQTQFNYLIQMEVDKKTVGKNGGKVGSPKKRCVISEKIMESRVDQLIKYSLEVGMEFESLEKLAEYCKISQQVISQWVKKGWITKP